MFKVAIPFFGTTSGIGFLPSQTNTVATTGASSDTWTFTFPTAPTAGHLVAFVLVHRTSSVSITTVPFSCSLVEGYSGTSGNKSFLYYKIADGTEGTTWTFIGDSVNQLSGVAGEWRGLTATPLDKHNHAFTSGTTAYSGLTGVLTQANELIITGWGHVNDTITNDSYNQGQTEVASVTATGSTTHSVNVVAGMGYKVVATTTSVNYSMTVSASVGINGLVGTFLGA